MPFPYDQVDDATMRDDAKGCELEPVVYLRDVGTDEDPCWVVCAKGDPGAVPFAPI